MELIAIKGNKFLIWLAFAVSFMLGATTAATALPRGEVRLGDPSVSIFIHEDDSKFDVFGFGGDLALSSRVAIDGSFIYLADRDDEDAVGDFNFKYSLRPGNAPLRVAPFLGWQRTFQSGEDEGSLQMGGKFSYRLSEFSSLHGGVTFLHDHDEETVGYALGFDYDLTHLTGLSATWLEIGYRRLPGISSASTGLSIGIRQYFFPVDRTTN